jgi:hypothetical protein
VGAPGSRLDRWSRSCGHRKRENGQYGSPSREDGSRLAGDAGPAGHHGPIVLICGLVGFAVGIVGLAALIQGIFDLHRMSKGEMDPTGRALTIIGMILGGLGFLLNVGLIVTILVLHISPF